jgi:hypothetical protein
MNTRVLTLVQQYNFGDCTGSAIAFFYEHAVELSGQVRPSIHQVIAHPSRLTQMGTHQERVVEIKYRPLYSTSPVYLTLQQRFGTDEWRVTEAKGATAKWRSTLCELV